MGEERESGGADVPGSRSCTKAAPATEHLRLAGRKRGVQRHVTANDRLVARPVWPRRAAALPTLRPAGVARPPHRELFLLLGSTPLKVVVVVMALRNEVGWRESRALKGSGPRGSEAIPKPRLRTAAGASAATACLAGRRFYKAFKPRPHPTGIGRFK